MTERPEWVKCVLLGTRVEGTTIPILETWCGRKVPAHEFYFVDPTHALLNARAEGRLLVCAACAKAMHETLTRGTA